MNKNMNNIKDYKKYLNEYNYNKLIRQLDRCSKNRKRNKIVNEFGIFKMYKSNNRGRFYSVSGSLILPNCGSLKIGSFRRFFNELKNV